MPAPQPGQNPPPCPNTGRDPRPGNNLHRGLLFILSAPSGAGKSTLGRMLRSRIPDLAYSVSYTTRKPRKDEVDGRDYHFISLAQFEIDIAQKAWAEWARVHDNYYGTRAADLELLLNQGQDVLLDIDVQGAQQLADSFPSAVTIFIMPPSLEVLEARLRRRDTDEETIIAKRLLNAREEIARRDRYRHVIINDDLHLATEALTELVKQYRCREPGEP